MSEKTTIEIKSDGQKGVGISKHRGFFKKRGDWAEDSGHTEENPLNHFYFLSVHERGRL